MPAAVRSEVRGEATARPSVTPWLQQLSQSLGKRGNDYKSLWNYTTEGATSSVSTEFPGLTANAQVIENHDFGPC